MNQGRVLEIGRYPVKSMQGESPDRATVATSGLVGDRSHGLFDVASGKVASAKDPRAWGQLLDFRAEHVDDPGGPLLITLPDGATVRSDDAAVDARLSAATGREVTLRTEGPADAGYDYVWEMTDIAPAEIITGSQTGETEAGEPVSTMPLAFLAPGTFQDVAPITVMTTAALSAMAAAYPEGSWAPARFRSSLLLDVDGDGVVENGWVGQKIGVGEVVVEVVSAAPRCVMTTLPQLGLPRDRGILQTVNRLNRQEFAGGTWACLGVYASVVTPGEVAVGDAVRVLD
jgi:uncharacterized protein YcbX